MRRSTDVLSVWSSRRIECVGRSSLDWARHPTFHELNSLGLVDCAFIRTRHLSVDPVQKFALLLRNVYFKYYLKAQKLKHRFFVVIKASEMIERRVDPRTTISEIILPFFEFSLKACFRFPKNRLFFHLIWKKVTKHFSVREKCFVVLSPEVKRNEAELGYESKTCRIVTELKWTFTTENHLFDLTTHAISAIFIIHAYV